MKVEDKAVIAGLTAVAEHEACVEMVCKYEKIKVEDIAFAVGSTVVA
jgi:hypothetical protein